MAYILFFCPQGMWDLSSPTRNQTPIPCTGRQHLNYWSTREVPAPPFWDSPIFHCMLYHISSIHSSIYGHFGGFHLLKWSESCSVVSDSWRPHGLYSPCNSPGQKTGVGSLSLPQGIFPTQGLNTGLPHCRRILYQLSHKGSPSTCWPLSVMLLQTIVHKFLDGNMFSFPLDLYLEVKFLITG